MKHRIVIVFFLELLKVYLLLQNIIGPTNIPEQIVFVTRIAFEIIIITFQTIPRL